MKVRSTIAACGFAACVILAVGVGAGATSALAAAPNGAMLFKQRCQSCHSVVPGKTSPLGPNLSGVGGRKAASAAFNYSPALKASGLKWTAPNLDAFIKAPQRKVPGTRMVISVTDAAQRAALVKYLASVK